MTFVCISACGLPDYTARLIRRFIEDFPGRVEVVATRPDIPIKGMEESLGRPIYWVENANDKTTWSGLGLPVPDVMLLGGYFVTALKQLAREVRKSQGRVILGSDNNWQGTFSQRSLHRIYHSLFLRPHLSGVMTPGKSGIRYCTEMGYPPDRIIPGMYGADPSIFFNGPPLSSRRKSFLYVGRFIQRKNVLGLARAFTAMHKRHPDWSLTMCGAGPDSNLIEPHPAIQILSFVQPQQLSQHMRDSRCLVLPSFEEHWGVVVHEAALSGCVLALSDSIGAADDFAGTTNSVIFDPHSEAGMTAALSGIASFDPAQWDHAQAESLRVASEFGPHRFSSELRKLLQILDKPALADAVPPKTKAAQIEKSTS
jgi:glycosyltransferase involved in cell wall biosynthesis